jgi:hypothetical protein
LQETGLVQDTEAAYETPRWIKEVLYDLPNSEVEIEKQSEKSMTSPGQSTSSSIGMQSKKGTSPGQNAEATNDDIVMNQPVDQTYLYISNPLYA